MKMRRVYPAFALIVSVLVLSACGTEKPYDKEAAARIHTIVVIGPDEPKHVGFGDAGLGVIASSAAVGAALGPIAGNAAMAGVSAQGTNETDLDKMIALQGLRLGHELRHAIETALENDGYQTKDVVVAHSPGKLLKKYDGISSAEDAILDVAIQHEWFTRTIFNQCLRPGVIVHARLVDPHSGGVLYEQFYLYVDDQTSPNVEKFVPDPKFCFSSREDILRHPILAAQSLRESVPIIANAVERDLAR